MEHDQDKQQYAYETHYRLGEAHGKMIVLACMLDEERKRNEQLANDNEIDALTGLLRREPFLDKVQTLYQANQRLADVERLHGIVMIDLDDFGKINKLLGHDVGDDCLRYVGQSINEALQRQDDFGCRWGGEEFVLFLPNTTSEQAAAIATRVREKLNSYIPGGKESGHNPLGATMGVTEYQNGTQFMTSFKIADQAMREAKQMSALKNDIRVADSKVLT